MTRGSLTSDDRRGQQTGYSKKATDDKSVLHQSGTGERKGSVRPRVRQADHINRISHQTPERTLRCGMKKDEFRISEVPPGSVLLMGDVAVFSVEGGSAPPKQSARTGRAH